MNEYQEAEPAQSKPGVTPEQILAMTASSRAAELSVAFALARQTSKQRAWMDRRGLLDDRQKDLLDARIENDIDRVQAKATEVIAISSIPKPEAGAMSIGGRVTKEGVGKKGLVVTLVGREGKAHGCTSTDALGNYRISHTNRDSEVLVMVSDAKGKKRLKLDDRPIGFVDGGIAIVNIELANKGDCPAGPDTTHLQTMPDLVGKSVEEAMAELKRINVGRVSRKQVERAGFEGRVAETEPAAGRLLDDPPAVVLGIGIAPRKEPEGTDEPATAAADTAEAYPAEKKKPAAKPARKA